EEIPRNKPSECSEENCRQEHIRQHLSNSHIFFFSRLHHIRVTQIFESGSEYDKSDEHPNSRRCERCAPSELVSHEGRNEVTNERTDVDSHVENAISRIFQSFIIFF